MTLAGMEVQRYPEPIQPLQGMALWLPGTIPGQVCQPVHDHFPFGLTAFPVPDPPGTRNSPRPPHSGPIEAHPP